MFDRLERLEKWLGEIQNDLIEIILVHDIQDNKTGLELRRIQEKSQIKVEYIEGFFGNPGDARNAGKCKVTGKWIMFCDGDDRPIISNIMKALEVVPQDKKYLVGGFIKKQKKKSTTYSVSEKNLLDELVLNPGIWRFIFRSDCVNHIEFPNIRMGEDQVFIARLKIKSKEVQICDLNFYEYYIGHPMQLTRDKSAILDLQKSINLIEKEFKETNDSIQRNFLRNMFANQLLTLLKSDFLLGLKCMQVNIRKLEIQECKSVLTLMIKLIKKKIGDKLQMKERRIFIIPYGGLGNQLFQLTAAISIAKECKIEILKGFGNGRETIEGDLEIESYDLPSNVNIDDRRNYFISKLCSYLLSRNLLKNKKTSQKMFISFARLIVTLYFSTVFFQTIRLSILSDIGYDEKFDQKANFILGYFQSPKWFTFDAVEKIKNMRPKIIPKNLKLHLETAARDKPVILHLRLGDYKFEDFGTLNHQYYSEALEKLGIEREVKPIWLFSDEPGEAYTIINQVRKYPDVKVMESYNLNSAQVLELMRSGRDYIIGNSTFGWWGAFLNDSQNKMVIYPNPWFKSGVTPKSIAPENWISLKAWK